MSEKPKKKKAIEMVKRRDKSIDVIIRENPAKTTFGRVASVIILIGFVLVPVITLVLALIQLLNSL